MKLKAFIYDVSKFFSVLFIWFIVSMLILNIDIGEYEKSLEEYIDHSTNIITIFIEVLPFMVIFVIAFIIDISTSKWSYGSKISKWIIFAIDDMVSGILWVIALTMGFLLARIVLHFNFQSMITLMFFMLCVIALIAVFTLMRSTWEEPRQRYVRSFGQQGSMRIKEPFPWYDEGG